MIFSRDFNCLWAFEVHFKFNVFCGIDLSGFDEFRNLIHVCVDAWLDLGTKPQNKKKTRNKTSNAVPFHSWGIIVSKMVGPQLLLL